MYTGPSPNVSIGYKQLSESKKGERQFDLTLKWKPTRDWPDVFTLIEIDNYLMSMLKTKFSPNNGEIFIKIGFKNVFSERLDLIHVISTYLFWLDPATWC